MLLDLPRDILIYILSLVVNDYYETNYAVARSAASVSEVEVNIAFLTDYTFKTKYTASNMAILVRRLSCVHPRIRTILIDNTKKQIFYCATKDNDWRPHKYMSSLKAGHFDSPPPNKDEEQQQWRWGFKDNFFNTLSTHSHAC
jgi:hypothetical protein